MYAHRLIIAFASLIIVTLSVEATTVYRKVDENGVVVFSDEPVPGAIPIELAPTKVEKNARKWRLPGRPGGPSLRPGGNDPQSDYNYKSFTIAHPPAGAAIRSNSGQLSASVAIDPALIKGHRVMYYIDGDLVASSSALSAKLSGISNGEHTLIAAVINSEGLELTRSKPVSFNLLRTANNATRENTPPGLTEPFSPDNPKTFEKNRPGTFERKRPGTFERKKPGTFQKNKPGTFQKNQPKPWNPPRPGTNNGGN